MSVGGSIDVEQLAILSREVLREMVQEKLKKQCIRKVVVKGSLATKEEINEEFVGMARRNQMSYDDFVKLLESNGISKNILLDQISVAISWVEYIRERFGRNVNISESEMNRYETEIKDKLLKESFYVSRMFFPVANSAEENSVRVHADNLRAMLQKGADFSKLAHQFSKGPEANNGGNVGWIFDGQLSEVETAAIRQMQVGSFKVVRDNRGYVLLHLREKKEKGLRSSTDVRFKQVGVGFGERKPSSGELNELLGYINDMRNTSKDCVQFIEKAKATGFMSVSDESFTVLESMQPMFRSILDKTNAGKTSDPVVVDGGVVVFCLLGKKVNTMKLPTRNEIKMHKISERLEILSTRELQDLTRKSYIRVNPKYDIGLSTDR
jgi:peptidyl-prolyl cis-trans isomerase SurA